MGARKFFLFWVAAVIAALALPGAAARAASNDPLASRPICVLPGAEPADDAAIFSPATRFQCGAKGTQKVRNGQWRRVSGLSLGGRDPWMVRWPIIVTERVTLLARYADGHVHRIVQADADAGHRMSVDARVSRALPVRAAPVTDLALRIDGGFASRDQSRYFSVAPASQLMREGHVHLLLWGLFAGIALAMLAYNFLLWTVLRFRFLLAYCLSVTAILAYGASWSGGIFLLDPDIGGTAATRANYLLLSVLGASVLLFANVFFEPWALSGRARRMMMGVAMLTVGAGLAFALTPHGWIDAADRIYYIVCTAMVVTVPAMCIHAWRNGSRLVLIFAAAWAAPLLSSATRLLNGFDLIPASVTLGNSTFYAMCVEALISTIGIGWRIRSIQSERDRANADRRDLQKLADTDPLTGLLNRRAFMAGATDDRTATGKRLILLDIDHFKSVNDRYGHMTGDTVLQDFAMLLTAFAPSGARVGRLGGEEFALLTDIEGHASDFPTAFLTALRALECAEGVRITASVGIAEMPLTSGEDWTALYKAADKALYAAKTAGRNRAKIYRPADAATPAAAEAA